MPESTQPGEIRPSVRGLQTLSGGTRNKVKIERPWQKPLSFVPTSECPLCKKDGPDKFEAGEGFRTFQNSFTPFPYHRLLIPIECWDDTKLRSLGGVDTLETAVRYAFAELFRTRKSPYPMWIYTHIGYGAGQNIPHNHWHLCEAPTPPQPMGCDMTGQNVLALTRNFVTQAWGVRAGQTVIRPFSTSTINAEVVLSGKEIFKEMIAAAFHVVELFNRKFNYPDYCLFFGLNSKTDFYVRYTPVLNNWGGSEFAALDHGTPFVLPWPHGATVEFLKS